VAGGSASLARKPKHPLRPAKQVGHSLQAVARQPTEFALSLAQNRSFVRPGKFPVTGGTVAAAVEVISHWHHSVEGLSTSSLDFYASVERALAGKEVPELHLARTVVNESGLLSAKREYITIRYGRLTFDVCGAPFGKDYFFSWWLTRHVPGFAALWGFLALFGAPFISIVLILSTGFIRGTLLSVLVLGVAVAIARYNATEGWTGVEDALLATPLVGRIYRQLFSPITYYAEDTRLMFEDTVHRTVVQIVEGILTVNKMPPIPGDQLRPRPRGAGA
jgi:hypothetical protein